MAVQVHNSIYLSGLVAVEVRFWLGLVVIQNSVTDNSNGVSFSIRFICTSSFSIFSLILIELNLVSLIYFFAVTVYLVLSTHILHSYSCIKRDKFPSIMTLSSRLRLATPRCLLNKNFGGLIGMRHQLRSTTLSSLLCWVFGNLLIIAMEC